MTNPLFSLAPEPAVWVAAGLRVERIDLVEPAELRWQIDAGTIGTIIDVREPTELAGGTLPNALNIPYRSLDQAIGAHGVIEPVLVICNSGNRSAVGASLLLRRGIRAINLAGGTGAWEEAGFPLVASM